MNHIVIVELHDLPSPYSCDDLWYKFRDVLRSLGARPDWKITTQGCAFKAEAAVGRSPQVELRFFLPEPVAGSQSRYADTHGVQKVITLEPGGAPHSLKQSDCDLVRQIADSLLPSLPVQILSAPVQCAHHPSERNYRVQVKAFIVPAEGATR